MPTTNYATANGMLLGEQTGTGPQIDYIPDALGSVVAAVNQNLTTTYTASYNPYGGVLASTGTAPHFTWIGNLGYLSIAGAPYAEFSVRARFYSTKTAHWASLDPIWPSTSPFAYSRLSPVGVVDPSGLIGCCGGGGRGKVQVLAVNYPPIKVDPAVCSCGRTPGGLPGLLVYKWMESNCTGTMENACSCDIEQWLCGTSSQNGVTDLPALTACPAWTPDIGSCPPGSNSDVCQRNNSANTLPTGGCINTVKMMGGDSLGHYTWATNTPNICTTCPTPASLEYQNQGTSGIINYVFNINFTTCCGCMPSLYGPWQFGGCQKWQFHWGAMYDTSDTPAWVSWSGECSGSDTSCT